MSCFFSLCNKNTNSDSSSSSSYSSIDTANPQSLIEPLNMEEVRKYVLGDVNEGVCDSLLTYRENDNEQDLLLHSPLSITIPPEKWAQCMVASTPRSSRSPTTLYTENSSSSLTATPSTNKSGDPQHSDDEEEAHSPDDYWLRVAKSLMTFELGHSFDDPAATVSSSVMSDIRVPPKDIENAYTQLMHEYKVWAKSRSRNPTNWKRHTMSSSALIVPELIPLQIVSQEQLSPRGQFLKRNEIDDELRTFVGMSIEKEIPLVRMSVMRCTEIDAENDNALLKGVIIIDINFAKFMDRMRDPYTYWILENMVKGDLGDLFDFVRISKRIYDSREGIVNQLIVRGVYNHVRGRIVHCAKMPSRPEISQEISERHRRISVPPL